MGVRGVRRTAAVVVLVAIAVGVGLFVGVWALGDGPTDDPDPEDARDPTEAETTTTVIATVEDLADALGCAEIEDSDDSTWVPVPGVESGGCGPGDGSYSAAMHVSDSAEAQEDLVAYFESSSRELPPEATPNGCPGDTDAEARERIRYHVVVGDRWVVTTFVEDVATEVADTLDGASASFSPAPMPPASYLPGGDVCGPR